MGKCYGDIAIALCPRYIIVMLCVIVLTDHAGVCVDEGRAVHQLEGVGAELSPVNVILVVTRQELGEAQPDYLPRQRLEHCEYK